MSWYRRSSIAERLEWERRHSSNMILFPPRRKSTARVLGFDDEIATPSIEELSKLVSGMEACTFEPTTVPAPPPPLPKALLEDTLAEDNSTDSVSEKSFLEMKAPTDEEICKALLEVEKSKCASCKSSPRISLTNVDNGPRYKYTLESFTERRQIAWNFEPYTGMTLDSPKPGHVPDIWSIECPCPVPFKVSVMTSEVPHTDCLYNCRACGGTGRKRCHVCALSGWEICSFCLGDGYKSTLPGYRGRCHECIGSGRKKCWRCEGEGMAVCRGCGGTGQIRCFIALTVNWFKHTDEIINEALPKLKEKLLLSEGCVLFEETKQQVTPISNFYNSGVCENSSKLIEKHSKEFLASEKLHQQRQALEGIPVSDVTYVVQGRPEKRCILYGVRNTLYTEVKERPICCILV